MAVTIAWSMAVRVAWSMTFMVAWIMVLGLHGAWTCVRITWSKAWRMEHGRGSAWKIAVGIARNMAVRTA